jgi:hypothetical protein
MEQNPSLEANSRSACQEFRYFYEIRKFMTVFTRAHHYSLSWPTSIESTSYPISVRCILILSPRLRLCLSSGLFHSGFPTNTLYTFVISPMRFTCPANFVLLDLIAPIILGVKYKPWGSSLRSYVLTVLRWRYLYLCIFTSSFLEVQSMQFLPRNPPTQYSFRGRVLVGAVTNSWWTTLNPRPL